MTTSRWLKKCCPALLQRAECGTGPDTASSDEAPVVVDPLRVVHGLHQQIVFQYPAHGSSKEPRRTGARDRAPGARHRHGVAFIVLCASVSLLGGCVHAARSEFVRHYTLGAAAPATANASPAAPSGGKILRVARIDAPPWLAGDAMYYRLEYREDNALAAYGRSAWIAPPPALLEPVVRNAIASAGGWRAVVGPNDPSNADVILRLQLEDFSQAFVQPETSAGTIVATATLVRARDNDAIAQKRFEVEAAAATPDAPGGAKALAEAADRLAGEVQRWIDTATRMSRHQTRAGNGSE